ncbi:Do family serine endopeptidase [Basilea psittacipulmonis]|uniref:Probable periplasmic serine endoprotease DegP-like n=1 Tax=Basilea psittacipulmonis DSM 24701 TaxID=1072685 RepID=A0A077DIE5_9BURK|nr:Do family serine endopeptidase [Basilea psittacipulmonis]AIL33242.1 hypothetical protein IX83_07990 [Basilea psittacipulmonis DSM 24701]
MKKNPLKKILLSSAIAMCFIAPTPSWADDVAPSVTVPSVALPDFTSVIEKTEKAVVNIRTTRKVSYRDGFYSFGDNPSFSPFDDPDDLFNFFFGFNDDHWERGRGGKLNKKPDSPKKERSVPSGVGSGFLISEDGYIITNNHVIDDADKITVTVEDKEYTAKVIGQDERTDIAVLKIDGQKFPFLKIGDSSKLKKGQWVLAIGSPFDLDTTATAGIVSAINRDAGAYLPFIQTDVAINPGNSGGPLINMAGEVVGVNSAIITRSGGYQGISLSIPIDEAMKIVQQLKSTGKVNRGQIGVQISDVSDKVAKAIGLEKSRGAMVASVFPDSPAEKAGIKNGDVIIKYDGKDITKYSDLPRLVGMTKPGSKVAIVVWRLGKEVSLNITIGSSQDKNDKVAKGEDKKLDVQEKLGFSVSSLPKDEGDTGVIVSETSELAALQGLRKGDIILVLGQQPIKSVDDVAKFAKSYKGKELAVMVTRDKNTFWLILDTE